MKYIIYKSIYFCATAAIFTAGWTAIINRYIYFFIHTQCTIINIIFRYDENNTEKVTNKLKLVNRLRY